MAKTPPFSSKVCSRCGQEKAASSFLLLSKKGGVYSSICETCRKKLPKTQEKDRTTRSGTGSIIDSKSKVHSDITRKEEKAQVEEEYYEEREEQEIEGKDTEEKKLELEDKNKTRRQNDKEKSASFLDSSRSHTSRASDTQRWAISQEVEKSQNVQTATDQEAANVEEAQKTETNFQAPVDTFRFGSLQKQGDAFKRFASWVGGSSPIAKTLQKGSDKTTSADQNPKETPSEMADRKWGPGSKP